MGLPQVVQPLLHFVRNQHFHIGRSCSQPLQHACPPSAGASEQPHTQVCIVPARSARARVQSQADFCCITTNAPLCAHEHKKKQSFTCSGMIMTPCLLVNRSVSNGLFAAVWSVRAVHRAFSHTTWQFKPYSVANNHVALSRPSGVTRLTFYTHLLVLRELC